MSVSNQIGDHIGEAEIPNSMPSGLMKPPFHDTLRGIHGMDSD
ncbi:MAG: hypothetical protein RL630_1482, partial [Verrucomicrobiota bacterium]